MYVLMLIARVLNGVAAIDEASDLTDGALVAPNWRDILRSRVERGSFHVNSTSQCVLAILGDGWGFSDMGSRVARVVDGMPVDVCRSLGGELDVWLIVHGFDSNGSRRSFDDLTDIWSEYLKGSTVEASKARHPSNG